MSLTHEPTETEKELTAIEELIGEEFRKSPLTTPYDLVSQLYHRYKIEQGVAQALNHGIHLREVEDAVELENFICAQKSKCGCCSDEPETEEDDASEAETDNAPYDDEDGSEDTEFPTRIGWVNVYLTGTPEALVETLGTSIFDSKEEARAAATDATFVKQAMIVIKG